MTDPTRHRQLEELDQVNLCTRILYQARNELYLNMRFLDLSLSSLGFEADWNRNGVATDGWLIYYGPGSTQHTSAVIPSSCTWLLSTMAHTWSSFCWAAVMAASHTCPS